MMDEYVMDRNTMMAIHEIYGFLQKYDYSGFTPVLFEDNTMNGVDVVKSKWRIKFVNNEEEFYVQAEKNNGKYDISVWVWTDKRNPDLVKSSIEELLTPIFLDIVGFTLLGKYDTPADLINYKEKLYQPQITINVAGEDEDVKNIGVSLDEKKGFKLVKWTNDGNAADYDGSEVIVKDAMINLEAGEQIFISVDEAKQFILDHYDCFVKQNDPFGHRCRY